jgi:hypothetical protein
LRPGPALGGVAAAVAVAAAGGAESIVFAARLGAAVLEAVVETAAIAQELQRSAWGVAGTGHSH